MHKVNQYTFSFNMYESNQNISHLIFEKCNENIISHKACINLTQIF